VFSRRVELAHGALLDLASLAVEPRHPRTPRLPARRTRPQP
jgi:hypothetical protein